MDEQRFVVTDRVWQRLEPHLPGKVSDAGATATDNRLFLEAVFWRVRTGSPWRDLPSGFGNWSTRFRRFRRWAERGVFEGLFNAMSDDPELEKTCGREESEGGEENDPVNRFPAEQSTCSSERSLGSCRRC